MFNSRPKFKIAIEDFFLQLESFLFTRVCQPLYCDKQYTARQELDCTEPFQMNCNDEKETAKLFLLQKKFLRA